MSGERHSNLPATLLQRTAIVYVRQSTQAQVTGNLESRRRQYDLVETAKAWGFRQVELIDDDMGISASGCAVRPGFEKLVASLCAGTVGAVFCLEVSRLARNGHDWHKVLELCGLAGARVVDHDGVYDPRLECAPRTGQISELRLTGPGPSEGEGRCRDDTVAIAWS